MSTAAAPAAGIMFALATELAADPRFIPLPGLRAYSADGPLRRTECYDDGAWRRCGHPAGLPCMFATDWYPDLDDPATHGVMWAILRIACHAVPTLGTPGQYGSSVSFRCDVPASDLKRGFDAGHHGRNLAHAILYAWSKCDDRP